MATEKERTMPDASGGARPKAKPAVICGVHPTRPDLANPDTPRTPLQYRAPEPRDHESRNSTLTAKLGAVRRGLERVAQQYAPLEKWHGSMTLKLVMPPASQDLPRPDGSRMTVPIECGPGTTFAKGLWQIHLGYSMAGLHWPWASRTPLKALPDG